MALPKATPDPYAPAPTLKPKMGKAQIIKAALLKKMQGGKAC
jgi:hypothetical protein